MQRVLSGTISVDQNLSSRGTVWKSSFLMSEDSGEVVMELVEVSMLSSLKDRWRHTDLAGECVGLQITGLHGVLCTGLKEDVLNWTHGVCVAFYIRLFVHLRWNRFCSLHLPVIIAV